MSSNLPGAYYTTRFVIEDAPTPLPGEFAIITGYNPMDEASSDEENLQADRQLRDHLENKGLAHFRVTGQSPDGSHREPGWAISMIRAEAVELARCFRQRALWWIEDGELLIIDGDSGSSDPIGRFSDRTDPQ
ncbi:DUF3293 domain-containing protein [Haloferula sp.]|uniref:DUF3293 domain-containing protein n=1 Tax=Haloferula sp. TaxID=2497595 RepID=UPI00329E9E8A